MNSKKVNLFHEHVLVKEKDQKRTPWHQDQGYYCVNGKDNVSIWIPLDKVDKNSSMEFIKGSHKWNKTFLPTKFKGYDYDHKDKEKLKKFLILKIIEINMKLFLMNVI